MERIGLWIVKKMLTKNISDKTRSKLTKHILDSLYALPFHDIITRNEQGMLLVNGREVDIESYRQLQDSAYATLQSVAFKLVNDQVTFNAVTLGVHKVERPEQMMFSRAAIWWGQQLIEQLKLLANEGTSPKLDL